MSDKERGDIRRHLGLIKKAMYHRCPAKSLSRAKFWAKKGEYWHLDPNHICPKCQCLRIAGEGTDHFGWGWCWQHEQTRARKGVKDLFTERHKLAIQLKNPKLYYHEDKYFHAIEQEAEESKGNIELRNEIDSLRWMMLKLMDKLKSNTEEFTGSYGKDGEVRGITDKESAELMVKMTKAIADVSKTYKLMENEQFIYWDDFRLWLKKVAEVVRDYNDDDLSHKFVDVMKKAGEPAPKNTNRPHSIKGKKTKNE